MRRMIDVARRVRQPRGIEKKRVLMGEDDAPLSGTCTQTGVLAQHMLFNIRPPGRPFMYCSSSM
jgi:hypothetical protein